MHRPIYFLMLVFSVCLLTFFAIELWEVQCDAVLHEAENRYQGPSVERDEMLSRELWREATPGLVILGCVFAGCYAVIFWQIGRTFQCPTPPPTPPDDP